MRVKVRFFYDSSNKANKSRKLQNEKPATSSVVYHAAAAAVVAAAVVAAAAATPFRENAA